MHIKHFVCFLRFLKPFLIHYFWEIHKRLNNSDNMLSWAVTFSLFWFHSHQQFSSFGIYRK